ncbi:MAG: thymidine phosphorylase [Proteobacteria bacterium]|nr:thymidine phosphorylase [Pseudomonadota bacterium]
MLPQEIIRKKRHAQALSKEEIDFFIKGVTDGSIVDAQTAALTMAVFLNGMNVEETANLTMAMRDSGDVLRWEDIDGPVVDKHSSGGVGDKVSLMLAPMIAACGGYVPMISGRGLGHTGGTLDKFDSIPGYQTVPSNELFRKVVKEIGCAIIGQTGNLAPADKKIYAIRDVCATVESVQLITASILSKKLAAGLDCLVMDLKCGNGAFMDSLERGRELARSIVNVANAAGTKTKAVLTDMNQVLGYNVGNALEVAEAVEYLNGSRRDPRLHNITLELCGELLLSANLAASLPEARDKLQHALDSGKALEIFARMVSALGGPADFCDNPWKYLPRAAVIRPVYAPSAGYVSGMVTRGIGLSIIEMKGGRTTPQQNLDYATGYSDFCQTGEYVDSQKPLAVIHAQSEEQFEQAAASLRSLIKIGDAKPQPLPDIIEKIS